MLFGTLGYKQEQALVVAAVRAVTREARARGDYPVALTISDIERWIGGGNFGPRLISERLRIVGIVSEMSRGRAAIRIWEGDVEEMPTKIIQAPAGYKGKVSGQNLTDDQEAAMNAVLNELNAYRQMVSFASMNEEMRRAVGPDAEAQRTAAQAELAEWRRKVGRWKALRLAAGSASAARGAGGDGGE